MLDQILQDLESRDVEIISRGLKFYITSDDLWKNNQALDQIFNLLYHEEYAIRDKTVEVLKFLIQFNSSLHETLAIHLLKIIGNLELNIELWFRCLELFTLLPKKSLPKEFIIKILIRMAIMFKDF